MSKVVALTTAPTKEPTKKKRERICMIETPPKPEWFVKTRERGRTVWYLRFTMTGILPRRFGPFQNRHRALLALDAMINSVTDGICNLHEQADTYLLKRQFQLNDAVIEDELAMAKGGQS